MKNLVLVIQAMIESSHIIIWPFFLIMKKEMFIDEYLNMISSRDLEKSKIFIGKI